MQTKKLLIFFTIVGILIGTILGAAYLSAIYDPNQKLSIDSVSKGTKGINGVEITMYITLYSSTSFKINTPYVEPCSGSVKLINESNWKINNSIVYYCPLIPTNSQTFGPGTYNSTYPVYLVPIIDTSNVSFPSELELQVSTMHNEFTSPIYTAKF